MTATLPPGCSARYETVRLLGTGGFGAVYLATHRELGRQVALKVLHAPGDEKLASRMLEEARISATLSHPGIVKLLDFDVEGGAAGLELPLLEPAPPRLLQTALRRAMAKRPEDRHRSAADLAADLQALLAMNAGVAKHPPPPSARAPGPTVLARGLALTALVAASSAAYRAPRRPRQLPAIASPATAAPTAAGECDAATVDRHAKENAHRLLIELDRPAGRDPK
jgi:hypothetical protein